jgi:hypothetical protein
MKAMTCNLAHKCTDLTTQKDCRNKETEQERINLVGWDWASYIGIKYGKITGN